MKGVLRKNELERLDALRRYEILDTPADSTVDHITELAAQLFTVPIATVSFVDHDRIWFKSHYGVEAQQMERDGNLSASTILPPDVYCIRDAIKDPRTPAHPLMAGVRGLRFYAAAPLRTPDGFILGTLCVIDRKPRDLAPAEAETLTKLAALVMDQLELHLAARKVADLEQVEHSRSEQLREVSAALAASEERFRDLFDEAPIAYVHEDLDTRFVRANRVAMQILGLSPDDISETFGKSLVPHSNEAQARLNHVLDAIERRIETSGVILELRRKDNGKPVWIEWWSKPATEGNYTRTMFLDITGRVLSEQTQARLEAETAYLVDEIRSQHNFGDIIGQSSGIIKVLEQVQLVAPSDASVLITGESGTGKELVARAIHELSARKGRAFIKVNCSAVPDSLFESEFFGHVKGAFTGALREKPGRFELADGGTLFLDEIGEIPLAMQAKLLRVLQEQEFERIGDTRSRKVDVRIIAATNLDLKKEVDNKRFRLDLFYRLTAFPLQVPPLRERREDIPQLAAHFVRQTAQRLKRPEPRIMQSALNQLAAYDWPGNVRELQNIIERAIIVWRRGPLTFDLAPSRAPNRRDASTNAPASAVLPTRAELKRQERDVIAAALKQTSGKIFGPGGAAELLGIKPTTLTSRITALRLHRRNDR